MSQITHNRHVGGDTDHDLGVEPRLLQGVFGLEPAAFDPSIQWNVDGLFGMLDLERSSVGLPAVRFLALEAVEDLLFKQAIFVIDTITEARHGQRRQRLQEASRQAAQTAVAQPGVALAVQDLVKTDAKARQHFAAKLLNSQV